MLIEDVSLEFAAWKGLPGTDEKEHSLADLAGKKAVFDVTGAGDTVVAVLASFGWGRLVDRLGPKRTLMLVLASWTVGLVIGTISLSTPPQSSSIASPRGLRTTPMGRTSMLRCQSSMPLANTGPPSGPRDMSATAR